MKDEEGRHQRREGQAREVEESQRDLRQSIAKTQKLVDQSDDLLNRHRRERDEAGD
jgi:hypothetical protein